MYSNLLEVLNLNVDYLSQNGRVEVLKNVSFNLPQGHVMGITGESGSGKTTLALSLLRLISDQKADIKGYAKLQADENTSIDLLTLPDAKMGFIRGNKISFVFQEPRSAFNPLFTCGSQIAETIRKHQRVSGTESIISAKEWLIKTDLAEPERIFHSYPHQLSGGQLQRAMIAMALCCRPVLLIADEPLASSDYLNHQSLLNLFRRIKADTGLSIIFISHDLSAIEQFADSVLVLHKGRLIEQGPVEKVIYAPEQAYTRQLVENRMEYKFSQKDNTVETAPLPDKSAVLKVHQLKKTFTAKNKFTGIVLKETNAINILSFELYKGETLGITGVSGSGKTTLARCLCGLLDADEGEILFKQEKILFGNSNNYSGSLGGKIQIVFQNPDTSLNPKRTIGDAIMEPLIYYRCYGSFNDQKMHALQMMEKAGLESALFNRFPHQLSGGQKQRAVIVRALVMQPEILICDEPVSALDGVIQSQILKLLIDLKLAFGFSMIFISHNLPVVKFISDRIMVLEKGIISHIGEPEMVMDLLISNEANY